MIKMEFEYCDLVPILELMQAELKQIIPYVGMQERIKLNEVIRDIVKIKNKIETY